MATEEKLANIIRNTFSQSIDPLTCSINQILESYNVLFEFQNSINECISAFLCDFSKSFTHEINSFLAFYLDNLNKTICNYLQESISSIIFDDTIYKSIHTFLCDISITDHTVVFNTVSLDNISDLIDLSQCPTDNTSEPEKHSMSLKNFLINILLPILALVLPMIQTHYLQNLNSLEEERHHLEEFEYQQRILQIEEEHLETERQILNYLEQMTILLEDQQADQKSLEESLTVLLESGTVLSDIEGSVVPSTEAHDMPNNNDIDISSN